MFVFASIVCSATRSCRRSLCRFGRELVMRDKGLDYEVSRFVTDEDEDSPAVMYAIAIATPLFIIACIFGAKAWLL